MTTHTAHQVLTQRIKNAGILLLCLALLSFIISVRRTPNADWLLEIPAEVQSWTIAETPLPQEFQSRLTSPKTRGIEFRNPLDERVSCQFIAPHAFEAYREPEFFLSLQISAQRSLPLFGKEKPLRAWILKAPNSQARMLVYAWLQTPQGSTRLFGERGLEQSQLDRLGWGLRNIFLTEPVCLVRLYSVIPSTDKNGMQTRRNMDRIARSIYEFNIGKAK
jgi:hypothetical protein